MKQKIIVISFIIFIGFFTLFTFFFKDQEVSKLERRKLAQFPKINGDFLEKIEDYIVDQFPLRNQFINLNSNINRNILQMEGYNNVYVIGNTIYEINYPLNEKQCKNFSDKINYIIEKDLQNAKIYYSIIPDKEYFLDDEKYLKLDYNLLKSKVNIDAKYINIINNLTIEDYYYTDIHWKQENLDKVVKTLIENMENQYIKVPYTTKQYNPFYGASYSKVGGSTKPDILVYLKSEYTKNSIVNHLEYGEKPVYEEEKLQNLDSYDVYLSGASSYIEIINKNTKSNKELIIFRDSYASSLAPLLIPYYKNITLVDLRYIDYKIVSDMLEFADKDVLFIYSTNIINNSSLLKVNQI